MFKRKSKYQNRWSKPEKTAPSSLDRNWSKLRLALVAVVFGAIWGLLWFRAWEIQIVRGGELAEKVSRQQKGSELITGFRGSIYDRDGQILARSVEVRSVYVRPYEVEDMQGASAKLAEILKMKPANVAAALNSDKPFVWLKRKVDDRTAIMIQKANLKGVDLATEFERVYPFKQLAGQLLGFVNIDDVGIEGLEKVFDRELSAQSTKVEVVRDAAGRKLYGELVMGILVNHDGRVLEARVERGSGKRLLDRQAEAIVASAAPFGEFTKAMRKDTDQFDVTALFKFTRRGLETTLQSDELIDSGARLLDGAQ